MHIPVLLKETIEGLNIKSGGVYVDATVNRAGHSKEIAKKLGSDGVLICIDLDQKALDEAKINLEKINNHPKLHFIHSNFRYLTNILKDLNISEVDGIVADLGLSSQELDISGRGFSFKGEEPLLMTFLDKPKEETTFIMDPEYYKKYYPLTDEAKARTYLNPGDGAVSRLCHEPRVALEVLHSMLKPFIEKDKNIKSATCEEGAPVEFEKDDAKGSYI